MWCVFTKTQLTWIRITLRLQHRRFALEDQDLPNPPSLLHQRISLVLIIYPPSSPQPRDRAHHQPKEWRYRSVSPHPVLQS